MAVQAARIRRSRSQSLADLAAAEKPLLEVARSSADPRPCFGFGTPGTL